ncbi:MAG: CDP-alcohol phosphatidyltransferase family protein [Clostridia bacterium]|nr:CDP-alcohol phosphatidyltransferase family protein [Clostridia bacterium]
MSFKKSEIFTVPNLLTIVRMALIPVFWVLMMVYNLNEWALAVFVIASATDVVDGFIARRFNQITDFGKLFDPLADKLMVLSVLLTLWLRGIISGLAVSLMTFKELFMIFSSAYLYKRNVVVHSLFVGKFAQCAVCAALFLSFFSGSFEGMTFQPHTVLLWIGIGAAYTAMFSYTHTMIRQLKGVETTYSNRTDKADK